MSAEQQNKNKTKNTEVWLKIYVFKCISSASEEAHPSATVSAVRIHPKLSWWH